MNYDKILMGGIGILTTLIGGWDLTLQVLLILMGVDVISGVIKGLSKGEFTSKNFRQGLVSKAGFLIVIILCYQIDTLLGNVEPVIRTTCAIFYITIEGSSIIENLGELGVPIPKALTKRLAKLRDMSEVDSENDSEEKTKIEK